MLFLAHSIPVREPKGGKTKSGIGVVENQALRAGCLPIKRKGKITKTIPTGLSGTHLNELTALIEPMLDDQAVTGDEARSMYDHVNQTRLEILQTWSQGEKKGSRLIRYFGFQFR